MPNPYLNTPEFPVVNDPRQAQSVHVEFYIEARENKRLTREQGRPIFVDTEMVRIRFPGDLKRVFVAPASDIAGRDRESGRGITYAEKYPLHYRAFREQNDSLVSGTPLAEIPFLSRSKIAELRALKIENAEQLMNLDERNFKRLGMGARELVDQVKSWMGRADKAAEIKALEDQNADLTARLSKLEAALAARDEVAADPQPEEDDGEDLGPGADFENWEDANLKAFIKDTTGAAPGGTPKHETLVRMARDAYRAAARAKEDAAA